jgi:hypothetical protein
MNYPRETKRLVHSSLLFWSRLESPDLAVNVDLKRMDRIGSTDDSFQSV